jgi:hypothetical protein
MMGAAVIVPYLAMTTADKFSPSKHILAFSKCPLLANSGHQVGAAPQAHLSVL